MNGKSRGGGEVINVIMMSILPTKFLRGLRGNQKWKLALVDPFTHRINDFAV